MASSISNDNTNNSSRRLSGNTSEGAGANKQFSGVDTESKAKADVDSSSSSSMDTTKDTVSADDSSKAFGERAPIGDTAGHLAGTAPPGYTATAGFISAEEVSVLGCNFFVLCGVLCCVMCVVA